MLPSRAHHAVLLKKCLVTVVQLLLLSTGPLTNSGASYRWWAVELSMQRGDTAKARLRGLYGDYGSNSNLFCTHGLHLRGAVCEYRCITLDSPPQYQDLSESEIYHTLPSALRLQGGESLREECGQERDLMLCDPVFKDRRVVSRGAAGKELVESQTQGVMTVRGDSVITQCLLRRCVPGYYYQHNVSGWGGGVWDGRPAAPCEVCGASPMHRCVVCGSSSALVSGATTADEAGLWLAFLCNKCDNATRDYSRNQQRAGGGADQASAHTFASLKSGDVIRWCLRCKRIANYGP